jgi:hypothetical protein
MARDEIPVSPEQVPEEARQYLAVIQAHQGHPFVRQHFHQVTWLGWDVPGHGPVAFFALEFRDGPHAALSWQDGQGNWGAGKWVRVAHPGADITCPPSAVALDYFQGCRALPSFPDALAQLAATRPPSAGPPAGAPELHEAVALAVAALQAPVQAEDEEIIRALTAQGVEERRAVRLVQFVPIAFCRFVFRGSGVQFADDYVVLGPDGQPAAQLPLAEDEVFREATAHCEAAAAAGQGAPYFLPVAARSGGFRAIQELMQKGARPEDIRTVPPVIRG